MNLLYCDANGVVVVIHKDTETAVPVSAYPNVVRIIPYDDLSTLQRVGPAPPIPAKGPPYDVRPYAQPVETPAILKDYSAQVRFNHINRGFNFAAASGAVPVETDRMSYMLVGNLAYYAASLPPTDPIHLTQGGVDYLLTAAETGALFNQFTALIQQCRGMEATCLADLNSGSPTIKTYADVDAKFAGI